MRRFSFRLISLVLFAIAFSHSNAVANGTPNAGKCYNGWHNVEGRCHAPHGDNSTSSGKRYIKNGGKCYNGWFLDTEKNKCVESRGLWGWITD
jgi:hypothetical protein